jgi:hypothetical protein
MKKAYCALSPRADEELFIEFCEDFDYQYCLKLSHGKRRTKIDYHTNVMMCLGETLR